MGFHGLDPLFFMGSLALFHGPAFRFDGWAPEFTLKWKTTGSHWSKQKNKSAQLANPTFSQHFPIQVKPHYIQLDPIYYGLKCKCKTLLGDVNNFFVFKSLLTTPSNANILPLHFEETFPPIIWIFSEGDEVKFNLPFKIFLTLWFF